MLIQSININWLKLHCFSASVAVSLFLSFTSFAQNPIPAIGYWRQHLNYKNATAVVKGDKIYCATVNNVFSIDNTNTVELYTKITGLNDFGVSCIGWDDYSQQLVIVYNNSNIDALKQSIVNNIGDVMRSAITGNKSINNVFCKNGYAYLCSGLGIIVADLSKYEIKDTWIIGNTGNQTKVNGFTADANYFYAATDEGIKRVNIGSNNLANYKYWMNLSGSNGLPGGSFNNVINCSNAIIAQKNDSLFMLNNNSWAPFYADTIWHITNINSAAGKVLICQRTGNGNSRVIQMNNAGVIEKNITQAGIISFPKNAIADNNSIWVADFYGGLSNFGSGVQQFIPNGPEGIANGEMIFNNDTLVITAGAVDAAWNYTYNRNGIYFFENDNWSFKSSFSASQLDSTLDFITVAADKNDGSLWAGSYGGGLIHFNGNQIKIFKQGYIQSTIGDTSGYRVSGLAFDQNNNLWISNYGAANDLKVRKADGTWKSFTIPFSHTENALSQIVVDDASQIWMLSPKGNGVFCLNNNNTIDNVTDDKWKYLRSGIGNGNLPGNNVYCLAKDKDGFIWVGTDNGIAVVQCAISVFQQNCDAVLPVVQQDAIAGYLFQNQAVQCIAVDGANRKWVGTKNGVWLVSADGTKFIYHFTTGNSPLLHNDVNHIAINPTTGEVFFATFSGICSFRSTATEGGETNNDVLVFPNPVPPGFTGTIAIRGLVNNAIVKIAELNGRLVYETRALGGQAIWNGLNYKGERVAGGVYLVFIKEETGTEKLVTKMVLIGSK